VARVEIGQCIADHRLAVTADSYLAAVAVAEQHPTRLVLEIASISSKCSRALRHGANGSNRCGCWAAVSNFSP